MTKEKFIHRVALKVMPGLVYRLLKFIASTMTIEYIGYDRYRELKAEGKNVIFAIWHGRLLLIPFGYIKQGKGLTILVGRHRDGEYASRLANRFGIRTVRGSTTRGWFAGVKGLLKAVRDGYDIAITPDGPKGPAMTAKSGAIGLAEAAGVPIIPVAFNASKKKLSPAGTPCNSLTLFRGAFLSAESLSTSGMGQSLGSLSFCA